MGEARLATKNSKDTKTMKRNRLSLIVCAKYVHNICNEHTLASCKQMDRILLAGENGESASGSRVK